LSVRYESANGRFSVRHPQSRRTRQLVTFVNAPPIRREIIVFSIRTRPDGRGIPVVRARVYTARGARTRGRFATSGLRRRIHRARVVRRRSTRIPPLLPYTRVSIRTYVYRGNLLIRTYALLPRRRRRRTDENSRDRPAESNRK